MTIPDLARIDLAALEQTARACGDTLALMHPAQLIALISRLRAAEAVVACARRINAGVLEDVRMTGVLTGYDAAVAGREGAA